MDDLRKLAQEAVDAADLAEGVPLHTSLTRLAKAEMDFREAATPARILEIYAKLDEVSGFDARRMTPAEMAIALPLSEDGRLQQICAAALAHYQGAKEEPTLYGVRRRRLRNNEWMPWGEWEACTASEAAFLHGSGDFLAGFIDVAAFRRFPITTGGDHGG